MTYTKPQIAVLDEAARAIKGQVKSQLVLTDFGGPSGSTGYNTQMAYEADE